MKKLLTSLLCVMMVVCFMPAMAWADSETTEDTTEETTYVAKVGENQYQTLEAAIEAIGTEGVESNMITLLDNVTLVATITISKDVTINLDSHNITGNNVRVFWQKKGTLTLTGTGTVTTVSAEENTINATSSVIRVGDGSDWKNAAENPDQAGLVIDTDVTIEAPCTYGVSAFGSATNEAVTVKGKILATGTAAALSGNGLDKNTATNITVEDGAVVSATGDVAIYHPQEGTLTVKGGRISGTTGIEMKGGTLAVTGDPVITATGEKAHQPNTNGTSSSGYAVAVVTNGSYVGKINVTLGGGTYTDEVAALNDNADSEPDTDETNSIAVTGGIYSSDIKEYVDGDATVATLTSNEETYYYIGETAGQISDAAKNGDQVEVVQGSLTLTNVADGVTVKNSTENGETVKVNGTTVAAGDPNGVTTYTPVHIPTIPTTPTTQKPVIEPNADVTTTLSTDGTTLTIKANDGYEITDVTVNGVSKGVVTTLTGLKTGDKVVVTAKKIETPDDSAALIEAVKSVKLVARSAMSKAQGKAAVKITWYATDGSDVELDGVEIFRSTKRYSGYGTTPIFTTAKAQYHNTAIKKGTKYYYKVRGYKIIDGEKVYTDWSTKAWRTVK